MSEFQQSEPVEAADPNDHLTLVGPGLALIVVHMQDDIVRAEAPFGSVFNAEIQARGVVEKCMRAADVVRECGGLVIYARIAFAEDGSDLDANMPLLQMAADAHCLVDGTEGAGIIEELEICPEDIVLTHTRPGPFTGSELDEILAEHGVRDVAVCGVATNASVEAAVRQAADRGLHAFVIEDACSAADAAQHEASIGTMGGLFARVISVNDLTQALP